MCPYYAQVSSCRDGLSAHSLAALETYSTHNSTFPVSGTVACTTTKANVSGLDYTRDQEVLPEVLVRCEEVLLEPPAPTTTQHCEERMTVTVSGATKGARVLSY